MTKLNKSYSTKMKKESNLYIIDLGITVKDRVHVADVMRKIRVMPDVQRVYRKK